MLKEVLSSKFLVSGCRGIAKSLKPKANTAKKAKRKYRLGFPLSALAFRL